MKKKSLKRKNKTRNKFEGRIYGQLTSAGVAFKYESNRIPYVLAGYYLPDFTIQTPTGLVYVETKGYFRPEHKRKMAAVKKQHSEIDLRLLFYSHNEANIRWANKNGIKWAVGEVPQEWIDGF